MSVEALGLGPIPKNAMFIAIASLYRIYLDNSSTRKHGDDIRTLTNSVRYYSVRNASVKNKSVANRAILSINQDLFLNSLTAYSHKMQKQGYTPLG